MSSESYNLQNIAYALDVGFDLTETSGKGKSNQP